MALDDEQLAGKTAEFRERVAAGEAIDSIAARSLRGLSRGGAPRARHASLRRPADRRDGAARRQDRRDAHRRGQDADRHAGRVPERARWQRCSRGHRQRLPGQSRRRVDGQGLPLPRHVGRHDPVAAGDRRQADCVCGRHHLRHQQRVRLRLPARQHGVRGRRPAPARTALRHRRRGRLDPDRRSAHAADHLGPGRRPHRDLPAAQRAARPARRDGRRAEGRRGRPAGRLLGRPQGAPGLPVRGRPREGRADPGADGPAAGRRQPLRRRQHQPDASPDGGAARAHAVPPRPALRGPERRSDHRRRVHRAADARPALVRRPAPGGRGQGGRGDPGREPDAGLDHLPELLPHVRQARRHDRHGRHRGLRVPGDLRARDGGHPDAPPDDPRGSAGSGVSHRAREARRDPGRHPRLLPAWPAGAGRHHLDRELRAAVDPAHGGQAAAPGAQRQAARARGRNRRPGGATEDDHDRDQHGRPRHRHRARRQRREAGRVPARRRVAARGRARGAHRHAARRVAVSCTTR